MISLTHSMKAYVIPLYVLMAFVTIEHPVQARQDVPQGVAQIAQGIKGGKYDGVTGGVLSVGGVTWFEVYAPGYSAKKRQDIRSATKSITALLIGKLIDEGKLRNTKVKLADILTSEFDDPSIAPEKRRITIEDLLTMRGGAACNDWAPASLGHEDKMYKTDDWFRFWVKTPQAYEIGDHFSYCTGGVVALGRVIERLAGQPVPDYAERVLFGPLGITGASWATTPTGHTDTGGHLEVTLSDLHKIGLLVADGGKWEGQQVITSDWVRQMTRPQTDIYERRQKYGYIWWYDEGRVDETKVSLIYAHGNGGNFIFIVPELEIVAAFTGKNFGKPSQFTALQFFTREIVPIIAKRD